MNRITDLERHFWSKVMVREPHECWPWVAALDKDGYGRFKAGDKMVAAHNFAYQTTGRTIQHELDHKCRSRSCVNPAHMEDVTHHENILRGRSAGAYTDETHCRQGHEFSEENTYFGRGDRRLCKTCEPPIERRTYAPRAKVRTHCRNGHEYSEDNIVYTSTGGRRCATCLRTRERGYYHQARLQPVN